MITFKKLIQSLNIFLPFIFFITSCTTTKMIEELSSGGSKVKIIDNKPNNCKSRGKIDFTYGAKNDEQKMRYLHNLLRNKAAENGANRVRLNKLEKLIYTGMVVNFGYTHYRAQAYTYQCP